MTADLLPEPTKIESADIYRDGGSYGICFVDSDSIFYELFIPVCLEAKTFRKTGYGEPILEIYDSENFGKIKATKKLTWAQGNELAQKLKLLYAENEFNKNPHSENLFEIISLRGNFV